MYQPSSRMMYSQTVLRREVDVRLVGLGVDARFEGHAAQVERVPPVPGDLARPDPRGIRDLRRARQQVDERVADEVAVVLGDPQHAPGKGPGATGDGDVVGRARDAKIAIVGQLLLPAGRGETSRSTPGHPCRAARGRGSPPDRLRRSPPSGRRPSRRRRECCRARPVASSAELHPFELPLVVREEALLLRDSRRRRRRRSGRSPPRR